MILCFTPGTSEDPESSLGLGKKFTQSEKPVTLEVVKGTLLAVADQMLSVLSEIIMENAAHEKGKIQTNLNPPAPHKKKKREEKRKKAKKRKKNKKRKRPYWHLVPFILWDFVLLSLILFFPVHSFNCILALHVCAHIPNRERICIV